MIVEPKVRGFICTTAHPVGCAVKVKEQINYVVSRAAQLSYRATAPKNVLIIGSSTGYGLASRIVAAYAYQAKTLGVAYEKPAEDKRTASAGWYNTAALENELQSQGHYAVSLNGDAFSNEMKHAVAETIKRDLGKIDLIIYSLASPRRIHPITKELFQSTLKPIGMPFSGKTVDVFKEEIKEITIQPAAQEEIESTIAVMGGDDWKMWIEFLLQEKLLADNVKTIAYSYIGPALTHAIYKNGTIGRAKQDLSRISEELNQTLRSLNGCAYVSINKALVTQASAAIPVVPLYISILYKLMKERGTHEGCIEQIYRLFTEHLYAEHALQLDEHNLIRLDDKEMDAELQKEIAALWPCITQENLHELTDLKGYQKDFYQLFGFAIPEVSYQDDVEIFKNIPSLGAEPNHESAGG